MTPPPPPPPPQPDYSLAINPSSVTLPAGGAPQTVLINEDPVPGSPTPSTVTVSFPSLPAGVTVIPSGPIAINPNSDLDVLFVASASVPVGPLTINVASSAGSVNHAYTISASVTAAASFHLSLSPTSLSLIPSVPQNSQVTVVPNSGGTPTVTLSVASAALPQGLQLPTPPASGIGPFAMTFSSTVTAQTASNVPFLITATDLATGNTSTAILPVSLTVPFPPITAPTRSRVIRTDDDPAAIAYDQTRRLLFVALPDLNEVRVYSSTDGHLVGTIPLNHPSAVDESADGSKVFAGSFGQVVTIDPTLLQVTGATQVPQAPTPTLPLLPVRLVTLSSGDVLILSPTDAHVFLWDPSTGTMTQNNPPGLQNPQSLSRSSDHSKVLISDPGTFSPISVIYDAATNSYGSPFTDSNASTAAGGASAALNADGSQVAILSAGSEISGGSLNFYDGQFNLLASLPLYNLSNEGHLIYSLDGSTLYAFFSEPDAQGGVGVAYNAQKFLPEGLFTMWDAPGTVATVPLAVDETGMIFGSQTGSGFLPNQVGLIFTDASNPGMMNPQPPPPLLSFPTVVSPPTGILPLSLVPGPPVLNGSMFDPNASYSIYFNAPPASTSTQPASGVSVLSPNALKFQIPAGSSPGPTDITLTRPDGWYQIVPEGFTYGPTILYTDPNVLLPNAQTLVTIYGYGFVLPQNNLPQVTIGGKTSTVLSAETYPNNPDGIFPLDVLQVLAPPGAPGPADITVTTPTAPFSSATVKGGVQYLASSQTYPLTGTLDDIVYDKQRQRLYVTNNDHNQVEVFDLTSQAFIAPILVGNSPTILALTPDDTKLAVLNSADGTVSVIDPSQLKVLVTYAVLTLQDQTCFGNANEMASAKPHLMLVGVGCQGNPNQDHLHALDLNTGSLSCTGIVGCDSTGVNIAVNSPVEGMTSTPDGSRVFLNEGVVQLQLLDLNQNTMTSYPNVSSLNLLAGPNVAADADGNFFISNFSINDAQLHHVNLLGDVDFLEYNFKDSLVTRIGEALNPSGSLAFLLNQSEFYVNNSEVLIFDTRHGGLAATVAMPESLIGAPYSITLDETGSKMFLITRSGITIEQLNQAPLSIASITPASGGSGIQITVRGSGFQNGATVTFGTVTASATFIDAMTLQAVVPSLPAGSVRVTVTNLGGASYSHDAAFTVQ